MTKKKKDLILSTALVLGYRITMKDNDGYDRYIIYTPDGSRLVTGRGNLHLNLESHLRIRYKVDFSPIKG